VEALLLLHRHHLLLALLDPFQYPPLAAGAGQQVLSVQEKPLAPSPVRARYRTLVRGPRLGLLWFFCAVARRRAARELGVFASAFCRLCPHVGANGLGVREGTREGTIGVRGKR